VYQEGRSPLARPEDWGQLIDLPRTGQLRVLDLGAGTGIFTRAWPGWGASFVVGLDPSLAMLAEARRAGLPAEARLLAGQAQRLPFAARTFDAAWLSAVIHHVTDGEACVRELARVVVPGGRVYLRGSSPGRATSAGCPTFPALNAPPLGSPPLMTWQRSSAMPGSAWSGSTKCENRRDPSRMPVRGSKRCAMPTPCSRL
jgi:SAM-dependent methyltransferase